MTLSDAAETAILELIFQAITYTSYAEDKVSAPFADIFVSLHTADPTDSGDQSTSEASYTGYSRIAVARTTGGWAISGDTIDNVAAITFGEKTAGGDETMTFFGLGGVASGATELLGAGALTGSLLVSNGVIPEFAIGDCNATLA